ncbi:hypothetical protein GCM10011416_04560 [Polaribacter pacificus]|uniref:Uncharacterized protein n=1 Tax=Polaribacter pacificus TaxID=1775173 RepID=A0A917MBV6_9FLAO|nr:hypothetical protein GCM10011416_04560 [Polaribacter pacificus]
MAFPKKYSLNGAIPELVNIRVGSFFNTIGDEGTIWCCFFEKKSKKVVRMSCDFIRIKFYNNVCNNYVESTTYSSDNSLITHQSC